MTLSVIELALLCLCGFLLGCAVTLHWLHWQVSTGRRGIRLYDGTILRRPPQ
jgi:hypothetical protein